MEGEVIAIKMHLPGRGSEMRSPAPSISDHPANVIRSKTKAPFAVDFDRAPFLVIWEVTRACALASYPLPRGEVRAAPWMNPATAS